MKTLSKFLYAGIVILLMLLAAGLWWTGLQTPRPGVAPSLPEEIESHQRVWEKIDPAMIIAREDWTIDLAPNIKPASLAVDAAGKVYLAADATIIMYDEQGTPQNVILLPESATCLTIDSAGRLLAGAGRSILIYDRDGNLAESYAVLPAGAYPTALAADDHYYYIADAASRRVWKVDHTGKPAGSIPQPEQPESKKRFIVPSPVFDLILAKPDELIIVNPGEHRLEFCDLEGQILSQWGAAGSRLEAFCGCCNPAAIAVTAKGHIVTCEKGIPRIKLYTQQGLLLGVIAGPDQLQIVPDAAATSENACHFDAAVDSKDGIWIMDPYGLKLRRFVLHEDLP